MSHQIKAHQSRDYIWEAGCHNKLIKLKCVKILWNNWLFRRNPVKSEENKERRTADAERRMENWEQRTENWEQRTQPKKPRKSRAEFIVCARMTAEQIQRSMKRERSSKRWMNGWMTRWPTGGQGLVSPVGAWESSFGSDNLERWPKSNYRK